jgi:hypothetical protein
MGLRNILLGSAAVAFSVVGFAQRASADVVSGQFPLGYSNGALTSGESAGLLSEPNWNVFGGGSASGTFGPLNDSTGAPTAITGSYSAPIFLQLGGSDSTPNQQLYAGSIGEGYDGDSATPASISLAGITYSSYDLIVYVQATRSGSNLSFSLNGGTPTAGINVNSGDSSATPVDFVEGSNYVEFDGLSGSTVSLTFTNHDANGDLNSETNAGVSGFQIVSPVPEPTSLGMLGIGALLLVRRRRIA